MIKIYLNKAAAEIESGQEILTAGMQKIVWVELEFSEDWDGLTKTAVFTNGATTVDVLESAWDGNRVAIAPEVLATAGLYAKIGIYGSSADGVALPTVWCKLGKVWPGADPSGDKSTLESLPVWAQLQAAIGSLDDLTTTAKENLVAAINEAAKSGGGGGTSADLSIRVSDGKIQWTKDGATWTDLIALSELKGTDGHTPEITAVKTDKTTTISVDGKAVAEIKDGENGTDGDDGYSPSASVSKSGTVTTVKITDKSGTTTAEVKDGEPGTDGTSVTISKISESTEDGGSNVVTFNDGKTLAVKNGNKGSDGLSPSVTVSKSGTETTVTATDKSGTTSAVIKDGEPGATGVTPSFSIGTVETLAAGSDATASITGTDEKPVLNLGIPKGKDGSEGSNGVTSFNGRSGAVTPKSGDYTADMVGADNSGSAAAVQGNLDSHSGNTTVHVTASERTTWNAKSGKAVSFTVTLTASGWSSNAQTVSDSRFLASGYAYTVRPAGDSFTDYVEAVIYADNIGTAGKMTFHCDTTPTADLTVNILRTEVTA